MNYVPEDVSIVLQEVPGEVSLTFSITGCGFHCIDCHSPYLQDFSQGTPLSWGIICDTLYPYSHMISCVLFMGGDQYEMELMEYLMKLKNKGYKTALYTGKTKVSTDLLYFLDYVKVGPYIKELGGLDSPNTNQHFYKREPSGWKDITSDFRKESYE